MSGLRGVPDHVGDPVGTTRWVNLPNTLTAVRLLLVPVLGWLLLVPPASDGTARWWATAVFLLAAVTDLVDGAIARASGAVTAVGKVADPIADKALTGMALISLSILGDLPWWVTLVILGREVGVTALRFWVLQHGVIPASRGGKAKTVAQIVAIAAYLAPLPDSVEPVRIALMAIAVVLTLATGVDYAARAWRLRRVGGAG